MKRPNEFKDPLVWLSSKFKPLRMRDWIEKACEVNPNVHNKAHLWTPLKLICFLYWLEVYTRIIPKYRRRVAYIDLLAGSGTNLIEESGDIILGSSLLAPLIYHDKFSQFLFFEVNEEKAAVLEERLRNFEVPNFRIFAQDFNTMDFGILNEFEHFFIFIDSEGLELQWPTIIEFLSREGDLILIFMTQAIARVLGKAQKEGESTALTSFMGDESWKEVESAEELLEQYMEKLKRYREQYIRRVSYHAYVDSLQVGGTNFKYHIILVCREGNYTKAWSQLKGKIEGCTEREASKALKICKGEIRPLWPSSS